MTKKIIREFEHKGKKVQEYGFEVEPQTTWIESVQEKKEPLKEKLTKAISTAKTKIRSNNH